MITLDNIIKDPVAYVDDIHKYGFQDIADGENIFKNIQPRDNNDEFAQYVSELFDQYSVSFNFVRKSPLNQKEPNFIHTDEMMGDITCILYLNGTTIYDKDKNPLLTMYSKFNRMVVFNSDAPHSRNILENFGSGEQSRLVQVIFLKAK
jgi:hypothetical protein